MTAFWYNLKFIKMAVNQRYFLRMCFDGIFIILDVMVDKYYWKSKLLMLKGFLQRKANHFACVFAIVSMYTFKPQVENYRDK